MAKPTCSAVSHVTGEITASAVSDVIAGPYETWYLISQLPLLVCFM
jgi:hypothetical protein